jgi:hypothetical protein
LGGINPNIEGVFINGRANNTVIANNLIKIADLHTDLTGTGYEMYYPYGIHLQGVDGFVCEHNYLVGAGNTKHNNHGIVINDGGANPNLVTLNNIDNLEYGATSLHMNWDQPAGPTGTGLEWKCNTFTSSCIKGIRVVSASSIYSYNTIWNSTPNNIVPPAPLVSGHKYHQGFCGGNESEFANNKFHNQCAGPNDLNLFHDVDANDFDIC